MNFFLWMFINLIGMVFTYNTLKAYKLPLKFYRCCNRYFNIRNGVFQIDHHNLSRNEWGTNILWIFQYAMIHYYFGNVYSRFNTWIDLIYLPIFLYSSIAFGIVGQIKGIQSSCSKRSKWSLKAWFAYGSATIVVISLLMYNIFDNNLGQYYFGIGSIILVFYSLMYKKYFYPIPYHVHHWFIGYILAFMFPVNDIVNNVMYAILYGIFMQGCIAYGCFTQIT